MARLVLSSSVFLLGLTPVVTMIAGVKVMIGNDIMPKEFRVRDTHIKICEDILSHVIVNNLAGVG